MVKDAKICPLVLIGKAEVIDDIIGPRYLEVSVSTNVESVKQSTKL